MASNKFVMKFPQVVKLQGKRTGWVNFVEICKMMKRLPEHVLQFFLTELGSEGALAGDQLSNYFLNYSFQRQIRC